MGGLVARSVCLLGSACAALLVPLLISTIQAESAPGSSLQSRAGTCAIGSLGLANSPGGRAVGLAAGRHVVRMRCVYLDFRARVHGVVAGRYGVELSRDLREGKPNGEVRVEGYQPDVTFGLPAEAGAGFIRLTAPKQ